MPKQLVHGQDSQQAILNAASIATLLLTTAAMVCEAQKTASGTSERQAED